MAGRGKPKGLPKSGGRKPGSRNKATDTELGALSDLAKQHTRAAIDALVRICTKGQSESAVVSASVALLDRGYGRPLAAVEHSGEVEHRYIARLPAPVTDMDEWQKRYDPKHQPLQ